MNKCAPLRTKDDDEFFDAILENLRIAGFSRVQVALIMTSYFNPENELFKTGVLPILENNNYHENN